MMRIYLSAAATLALVTCAAGSSAQTSSTERKEKTKVEITGGKNVTLKGCLERSSGTTDYVLTDEGGHVKYAVVTNRDLSSYVDHRVEVKGRAADQGDANVKVEHRTEATTGEKAEAKVETKGDSTVMPYLGLRSIKTAGTSCSQ